MSDERLGEIVRRPGWTVGDTFAALFFIVFFSSIVASLVLWGVHGFQT